MAGKSWYLTATTSSGWRTLDESPVAAANSTDGWVIGKAGGANTTAAYYAGVKRAASAFGGTTAPDGSLDTVNFDTLRTTNTYNGSFVAGAWSFNFVFRPTLPSTHRVAAVIRLFRGANGNGTGATQITTAQQLGATTAVMSSAAADYASQISFDPGAIVLANEYLWIQLALKRVVKGGTTTCDCVFRTGSSAAVGTRIFSPDFSAPALTAAMAEGSASAADAPSVVSMGYRVAVAEGGATATDTPSTSLLTASSVVEGGNTALDTSDATVTPGSARVGRVAWIRFFAPREFVGEIVAEGGPTAHDTCDAQFAIAASVNEGGPTAQDSVSARAAFAAEVREGSPIAVETYEASANLVTNAVIAEGGNTAHENLSSLFDAAQAFQLEGEDTALDLCEAVVIQPAMCAEGGPTAIDTISTGAILPVLVFEGGDTAADTVEALRAYAAAVAEGAPSALDLVDALITRGLAEVAEGADTAQDECDAIVEPMRVIDEGADTAQDYQEASFVTEASVAEGDDTAEDECDARPEWFVMVEEGSDTANDLQACDLGDRHKERTRRYLVPERGQTYALAPRATITLTEARVTLTAVQTRIVKVDEPVREAEFVPDSAPEPHFEE